uniref:Ribosome biogenesis protein BRX1 homolog n=1 Tax=Aceria tosichella TaxID=561515 RepID=A0A6G1SDN5_9ACAR
MSKKTKCLVLCSRGVTHQDRHLMLDMRQIIPHSKKDCKFDKKDSLSALNELAGLSTCDKCLYFENRKGKILLMWASNINGGPSVKFLVKNVHTMQDIKLVGNCLRGSRPVLSFDDHFERIPHLRLIKEIFVQIFNVPYKHPKSQPFVDRVVTFSFLDGHIWFRNYQILDQKEMVLAEIGPRMALMPMLILSSSFQGEVLWANFKKFTKQSKRPKIDE